MAEDGDAQAAGPPQQPGEEEADQEHLDDAGQRIAGVQGRPQAGRDQRAARRSPAASPPAPTAGSRGTAAPPTAARRCPPPAAASTHCSPNSRTNGRRSAYMSCGKKNILNDAHCNLQHGHQQHGLEIDARARRAGGRRASTSRPRPPSSTLARTVRTTAAACQTAERRRAPRSWRHIPAPVPPEGPALGRARRTAAGLTPTMATVASTASHGPPRRSRLIGGRASEQAGIALALISPRLIATFVRCTIVPRSDAPREAFI